jgi:hypothetical protein
MLTTPDFQLLINVNSNVDGKVDGKSQITSLDLLFGRCLLRPSCFERFKIVIIYSLNCSSASRPLWRHSRPELPVFNGSALREEVKRRLRLWAGETNSVPYQFKREPLTQDESQSLGPRVLNHKEKLVISTLDQHH